MKRLFATLSEKDRRRYAAIEAAELNHGGFESISRLFAIDAKTVRRPPPITTGRQVGPNFSPLTEP